MQPILWRKIPGNRGVSRGRIFWLRYLRTWTSTQAVKAQVVEGTGIEAPYWWRWLAWRNTHPVAAGRGLCCVFLRRLVTISFVPGRSRKCLQKCTKSSGFLDIFNKDDDYLLNRIVTEDETWVKYIIVRQISQSKEWVRPYSLAEKAYEVFVSLVSKENNDNSFLGQERGSPENWTGNL